MKNIIMKRIFEDRKENIQKIKFVSMFEFNGGKRGKKIFVEEKNREILS